MTIAVDMGRKATKQTKTNYKIIVSISKQDCKRYLRKLKKVAKLHIKTLRYKIIIWKALGVPL